jgi:predicted nucleic acid-binding protein
MTSYLLDTNVVSELRKPKPHGGVRHWFEELSSERMFIPAVVLGELQAGIELTRRQDPGKAAELTRWVDQIEATSQVVPMGGRCFREYARLMHGHSDSLAEDAMIAATAQVHGLTVATRNERDFIHFAVAVFNPFKHRSP